MRDEGELLAAAVERADPGAGVPTCPGWSVRDLARHTGGVHRWARAQVAEARQQLTDADLEEVVGAGPADADLGGWLREGVAELATTLAGAPPDLACATFLPAASPVAMWARRQAHETGIHRADAEGATGPVTAYPVEVAVDGIDELLTCFAPRRRTGVTSRVERSLAVVASDADAGWLVRVTPEGVRAARGVGSAEATVSGPASDVLLLLWNRRGTAGLDLAGDGSLLDLWRDGVRVRWG